MSVFTLMKRIVKTRKDGTVAISGGDKHEKKTKVTRQRRFAYEERTREMKT